MITWPYVAVFLIQFCKCVLVDVITEQNMIDRFVIAGSASDWSPQCRTKRNIRGILQSGTAYNAQRFRIRHGIEITGDRSEYTFTVFHDQIAQYLCLRVSDKGEDMIQMGIEERECLIVFVIFEYSECRNSRELAEEELGTFLIRCLTQPEGILL